MTSLGRHGHQVDPANDREQKRVALGYLQEAWAEARLDGVDGDCLAQACLFAALPRLAGGEAVTSVALDLGYENVAAFTTMFRRMLGKAPRNYLKGAKEAA